MGFVIGDLTQQGGFANVLQIVGRTTRPFSDINVISMEAVAVLNAL